MSFARYLHEHRDDFVDLRVTEARGPGVLMDEESIVQASGVSRSRWRGGSVPGEPIRYRQVRPAFAPSPFHDPLPYLEPGDRR